MKIEVKRGDSPKPAQFKGTELKNKVGLFVVVSGFDTGAMILSRGTGQSDSLVLIRDNLIASVGDTSGWTDKDYIYEKVNGPVTITLQN